jgi:hypothetical protein
MQKLLLTFVVAVACACSSEDKPATAVDAGDTGGGPQVPASSCVRPGDKGNEKGIGEPCTPLGKECANFAGAPLCLADVGQDQWMCSRIGCSTDADCGTNATCYKDPKGSGCVPNRCLSPSDAGADTAPAMDAASETSTDAPSDG